MRPWQVLSEKTLLHVAPWLRVVQQCVRLPDGREIDDFYQVVLRDFAKVVPVTEAGEILIVRQYKHGAGVVSVTFPAGYIEPGEAPEAAARREMLEETGFAADAIVPLGAYTDNGNQRAGRGHYFLATGCRRVADPDAGDLEEMSIETVSPAALDALLLSGGFALTHSVAAWGLARAHLAQAA